MMIYFIFYIRFSRKKRFAMILQSLLTPIRLNENPHQLRNIRNKIEQIVLNVRRTNKISSYMLALSASKIDLSVAMKHTNKTETCRNQRPLHMILSGFKMPILTSLTKLCPDQCLHHTRYWWSHTRGYGT